MKKILTIISIPIFSVEASHAATPASSRSIDVFFDEVRIFFIARFQTEIAILKKNTLC